MNMELENLKPMQKKDHINKQAIWEYYRGLNLVDASERSEFARCLLKSCTSLFVSGSNSQKEITLDLMQKLSNQRGIDTLKESPSGSLCDRRVWKVNKKAQRELQSEALQIRQLIHQFKTMGRLVPQRSWDGLLLHLLDLEDSSIHQILDLGGHDLHKFHQILSRFQDVMQRNANDLLFMVAEKNSSKCNQMIREISSSSPTTPSPFTCVINVNAKYFPRLKLTSNSSCSNTSNNTSNVNSSNNNSSNNNTEFLLFDRIMCCLPCSNDGILIENDNLNKWSCSVPLDHHGPLCEMLNAGLRVLNVRGRLVYAVYSMNPVECEAVVSAVLLQQKGSFELVDVRSMMGDIKYEEGLTSWKLLYQRQTWFENAVEVPHRLRNQISASMFPPANQAILQQQHLTRCVRIMPHKQESCGLFIAVFKRVEKLDVATHKQQEDAAFVNERKNRREHDRQDNNTNKRIKLATDDDAKTLHGDIKPGHKNDNEVTSDGSYKMAVIDDGESRQNPFEDSMDEYIIRDSVNSGDETTNQELQGHNDDGGGRDKSRFEDAELHNEQQYQQQQPPPQQPPQQQQSQQSETHFIKSKRINFIEADNPDVQVIRDFYGLLHFPVENLMIEKLGTYPHRLYYVSDFVKNVISSNHDSYAFPRAGVKMFNYRSKDDTACKFIICQEGLPLLYKYMTKRIIHCSKKDFVVLARSSRLLMYNLTANMQNKLNKLENGCFAVVYNPKVESNLNASNQSETINAPVDDSLNSEDDFFALVCLKTEHAYVVLTSEYLRKYYLQRLSVSSHEMEVFRPSNSCKEALVNFAFYLEQAGL